MPPIPGRSQRSAEARDNQDKTVPSDPDAFTAWCGDGRVGPNCRPLERDARLTRIRRAGRPVTWIAGEWATTAFTR